MANYKERRDHRSHRGLKTTEEFIANGTVETNIGNDAIGDMYYRSANGKWNRLPIGTSGYAMVAQVGGIPGWQAPTNQLITLSGDVLGSGTTNILTSISNNAVTTLKIADVAVTTPKIADAAVTYAKVQDISGPGRLLGRSGAASGNGPIAEILVGIGFTWLSNSLNVQDNTTIQKVNVLLSGSSIGSRPTLNFIPGTNISGISISDDVANDRFNITINASQSITLSGDVTGSGATTISTTIANNVVSNVKLAQMAAHTFKGNNTSGTANALDLTATELTAELNLFSSTLKGLVPLSGGGTVNYLRADGTWTSSVTASNLGVTTYGLFASKVGIDLQFKSLIQGTNITLAASGTDITITNGITNNNQLTNGSGFITGNQTITLTGNITGSGTTSISTTIGNNVVTNAMQAQMAAHTFKGNNTGSTANVINLTATELTAELNLFSSTLKGLTPLSGGGTINYLRADGTWAAPPGGGPLTINTNANNRVLTANGGTTSIDAESGLTFDGTTLSVSTNATAWAPVISIANAATGSVAYAQIGYIGNVRTWGAGVANSSETNFGVANRYFVYDQTANLMRLSIDTSGNIYFHGYTGTGTRMMNVSSTGLVGSIINGTDGYVLTMVSGTPAWAAPSGGSGYTVTNEADNRIITSTGVGAANAEANLTWDNAIFKVGSGKAYINTTSNLDASQDFQVNGTSIFIGASRIHVTTNTFPGGFNDNILVTGTSPSLWFKDLTHGNGFLYATNYNTQSEFDMISTTSGAITNVIQRWFNDGSTRFDHYASGTTSPTQTGTKHILTVDANGLVGHEVIPSGGVSSVGGTTDRITTSGTSVITIDIASTYVGQTSIITLGIIGTGTWQGTPIGTAYGGAPSGGTTGQVLKKNSNTSYDYVWATDATGGGSGVTDVTGTTNRITSTGGTTPQIDISSAYVGQGSIVTVGTIGTGVWNAGAVTSSGTIQTTGGAITMNYDHGTNVSGIVMKTQTGSTVVSTTTQGALWVDASGVLKYLYNGVSVNVLDNQNITLSGDVTGSGSSSISTTIANNVVSNAKLAQMAAHTFKGNNTGSTANALDLTATQLTAEINLFTSALKGVVPASGGGTINYLRADGTWADPAANAWIPISGNTTSNETIALLLYTPSSNERGWLRVQVTSMQTDLAGGYVRALIRPYKVVSGSITLGTQNDEGGTGGETDGTSAAALTIDTSAGNIRVKATGTTGLPTNWNGHYIITKTISLS